MFGKQQIVKEELDANYKYLAAEKGLTLIKDDILLTAKKSRQNAEKAYLVGEISYLDFLSFKWQLLNAQLKKAETYTDLKKALAQIRHSVGFKNRIILMKNKL